MTVSMIVANPAQTVSLDMVQEQSTQSLSLVIADGSVALERQPVSLVEMPLLAESGLNIDFLLNEYAVKA